MIYENMMLTLTDIPFGFYSNPYLPNLRRFSLHTQCMLRQSRIVSPGTLIPFKIFFSQNSHDLDHFMCMPPPAAPLHHRSSVPNIKFTPAPSVDRDTDHLSEAHILDTSELERELQSLCMSVTDKVMDKDT